MASKKKTALAASTPRQKRLRRPPVPRAREGITAALPKPKKAQKIAGTAQSRSRKSGPVVGHPLGSFRFDTSQKASSVKGRFAGPIGYPRPEGVKRRRSDIPRGWRFKTSRPLGPTVRPTTSSNAEQLLQDQYIIHGVVAGSKNEWYLYQALLLMGVSDYAINYQVPWHGGRTLGGQVLDFVVDEGGAPTVLRLMGHYWHPTAYGKPLDVYTKSQLEGEGYRVEDIPDYNASSVQDAVSTLSRLRVV